MYTFIAFIFVAFFTLPYADSSPVASLPHRAVFTYNPVPVLAGYLSPVRNGYNRTYPLTSPVVAEDGSVEFRLAIIADMDKLSKDKRDASSYISYLKSGAFTIKSGWTGARIVWDTSVATGHVVGERERSGQHVDAGRMIQSQFAFGSRGMELSDLTVFNGKLYACEDRTGIVFQIVGNEAVPWVILADADGMRQKGFKCEWSVVKDEHLIVGSHSADIKVPHPDGPSVNAGQRWIKKISKDGLVEHIDWNPVFKALENHLGIRPPGYVMHETVLWSEKARTWYFLPRQISHENYTDERHPYTCSNMMIIANEDFTQFRNLSIGEPNPLFGFSAARFVPGTDDTVIIALRIMEIDDLFSTRIVVFSITGTILLVEEEVLEGLKYEGLEFI